MTETKLWYNDEEIAEVEGKMGRPGFASTWSYAVISNLLSDRRDFITTIESQQEKHREELQVLINSSNTKIWNLQDDVKQKDALIESQKEEIKRYNELFQEIGIMCAFDQPPQILRILAVLQNFQQGEKK